MVPYSATVAANLAWLSSQQARRARRCDLAIGLQHRRRYDDLVAVNFYPLLPFCKFSS